MDTWIWESVKTIEKDKEINPVRVLALGLSILSYIIEHISETDDRPENLSFQDFIYVKELTDSFENWVFDRDVQDVLNMDTGMIQPIKLLECGVTGIRGIWRTLFGYKRNQIKLDEWINISCEIKLICLDLKEFIQSLIDKQKGELNSKED